MALRSMGRQGRDQMAVGGGGGGSRGGSSSSIALLQERFRHLEKMREKREEMELLKLFSGSEQMSQNKRYEPPAKLLVNPEMIFHQPATTTTTITTTRPPFQDSLSLGLDLYSRQSESRPAKNPPFTDFWSIDSTTVSTSRAQEKPDVDTSLHL